MVSCSNQSFAVVILLLRVSGVQFAFGEFPFLATRAAPAHPGVYFSSPGGNLSSVYAPGCHARQARCAAFHWAILGGKVAAFCVKLEEKVPT